jgi:molecular chaperone GrpE
VNEERRPANGESADASPSPSPPADEARDARPAAAADGASEGGVSGGPEPEAAPAGSEPEAETEDGAGRSAAGTEPGGAADADGEPGAEAEGEGGEAPAGEPEEAADTVESLRARLDAAREEAEREHDAALRARAEVENVRRRAVRDVEQAHRFGVEGLVRELLPVRDSLELGIGAAHEEGSAVEALAEGTEMTLRMLTAALEKFGAVEVDPAGEDFDPRFHEAMSMQEAEGVESGKVIQVFQKGCLLHGRVVRPAMVIVSR